MSLVLSLYIDGERVDERHLRAGLRGELPGIRKTTSSILPFKFQNVQLVGAYLRHSLRRTFLIPTEDPDVENAPVVPEMGTIELRAYRCRAQCIVPYLPHTNGLREGRVSERSKKAGWHHVR